MATEALRGFWVGYAANDYKRAEDSARVGINRLITTSAQIASIFNAFYLSEKALISASLLTSNIGFPIKAAVSLTPIITNTLCAKIDIAKHPRLKKSILLINNHISSLCHVAIVVSSISLIYFGQPILGSVSLAFVVVGFVQRRCWIPTILNKGIDRCGFIGINAARILLGDPFYKFVAICEIGNFAYLQISHYRKEKPQGLKKNEDLLITESFDSNDVSLNSYHVSIEEEIPPPPDIKLDILNTYFNQIDWNQDFCSKMLIRKVSQDQHWRENYGDKNSFPEQKKYIEKGIKKYVDAITKKEITNGVVHEYKTLEARAKHIASHLANKSDEEKAIQLVELGLASFYCAPEYRNASRAVYYSVCDATEEDSIDSIVYRVLNDSRRRLLHGFIDTYYIRQKTPLSGLIDFQDLHFYNEFVNFLGDTFHLPEVDDANEDALSSIDIVSKKILQYVFRPLVNPFLNAYNKGYIIENVQDAVVNRQIPYELIKHWFIEQYMSDIEKSEIEGASLKEIDRTQLREKAKKWVESNVYDVMTGGLEEKYLQFFLIKMGVFQLETSRTNSSLDI